MQRSYVIMEKTEDACACVEWNPVVANGVRFCAPHHKYWRGAKELVAVSRLIKSVWPVVEPEIAPHILENARNRGVELDTLFSAYVAGTLKVIPKGTRQDVVDLFEKQLQPWWDKQGIRNARTQVLLADNHVAGTCDLMFENTIWDLKCVYSLRDIYPLQVGMYALTSSSPVDSLGLIHVHKRFKEPQFVDVPAVQAIEDALIVRSMYFMVQRRATK
jgi:hypothetical protein